MKLTYWMAECLNDSSAYNLRAKTKREVVAMLDEHWDRSSYGPPRKVTVEYADGFDLMAECLSEGGAYWEATPYNPNHEE
jgi:hypothetical protein